MKILLTIPTLIAIFLLTACPDPQKAKEDLTEPVADTTSAVENSSSESTPLTQAQVVAQELEKERVKLEEMINRIMSEDVYFDFDKASLTEKARELMAQIGDILLAQQKFRVVVEGHTDERGTEAYNLSLGGKRAQAVQKYLLDYGVPSDRIQTMSYGEEKPKTDGASEENMAQNRRAHFRVVVAE